MRGHDKLGRIAREIDWPVLQAHLASLEWGGIPPLSLFKLLLLGQWYRLEDTDLVEALADRASFRQFTSLSQPLTVWEINRFRLSLARARLERSLFEEVARQLAAHGVGVAPGMLRDAMLVPIEQLATPPAVKIPPRIVPPPSPVQTGESFSFRWKTVAIVFGVIVLVGGGAWITWHNRVENPPLPAEESASPSSPPMAPSVLSSMPAVGAGLHFRSFVANRLHENGEDVLEVRGVIDNQTDERRDMPFLRLTLYEGTRMLVEKVSDPPIPVIDPHGSADFRLTFPQPPAAATRFDVTFTRPR